MLPKQLPPRQVEAKQIDPEAELSNVQRTFRKLAPMCSVEKRSKGIPQLAPQEKQLSILRNEMRETLLCIDLATKGLHAVRDAQTKRGTLECIIDYEQMETILRDEKSQQTELDCLNYLSRKQLQDKRKSLPTEVEEQKIIETGNLRLRQMENRLEIATKKYCVVSTDNKKLRTEIDRLMVERNDFNTLWNRAIGKLVKGKEYLMDIFEIATEAGNQRDECCTKLEALKWKGLFQLNRDIAEMQAYETDLNNLGKIEEFLRVKGSRRICEADELEELKNLEEMVRCEAEIAEYDEILNKVFLELGSTNPRVIVNKFNNQEVINFSVFEYLCEILQESIILRKDVEQIRQQILDQKEFNSAREERERVVVDQLKAEIEHNRSIKEELIRKNKKTDDTIAKVLNGIDGLVKFARCESTPLLSLLGNHKQVTKWNVSKFLKILECEAKSLVQVVYGVVKPPPPTPQVKGLKSSVEPKIVADPLIIKLKPNKIQQLIPYLPCAYCVEDFIMNLVFETPAVPADEKYISSVFHLEEPNTKFGIFTLTIPSKRHPYRGWKNN